MLRQYSAKRYGSITLRPGLLAQDRLPGQANFARTVKEKIKLLQDLKQNVEHCRTWVELTQHADMRLANKNSKTESVLSLLTVLETDAACSQEALLVNTAGESANPLRQLKLTLENQPDTADDAVAQQAVDAAAQQAMSAALLLAEHLASEKGPSKAVTAAGLSQLCMGLFQLMGPVQTHRTLTQLYDLAAHEAMQSDDLPASASLSILNKQLEQFTKRLDLGIRLMASDMPLPQQREFLKLLQMQRDVSHSYYSRLNALHEKSSYFGQHGARLGAYLANRYRHLSEPVFEAMTEALAYFNERVIPVNHFLAIEKLSPEDAQKIWALARPAGELSTHLVNIAENGMKLTCGVNAVNARLAEIFLHIQAAQEQNSDELSRLSTQIHNDFKTALLNANSHMQSNATGFLQEYSQLAQRGKDRRNRVRCIEHNVNALRAYISKSTPLEAAVLPAQTKAVRDFLNHELSGAYQSLLVLTHRQQDRTCEMMHRAMPDKADPRKTDPLALVLTARILQIDHADAVEPYLMDAVLIDRLRQAGQAKANEKTSVTETQLHEWLVNPLFAEHCGVAARLPGKVLGEPQASKLFDLRLAGQLLLARIGHNVEQTEPCIELWQKAYTQIVQDGNSAAGLAAGLYTPGWYVTHKPLMQALLAFQASDQAGEPSSWMPHVFNPSTKRPDRVRNVLSAELSSLTHKTVEKLKAQGLEEQMLHQLFKQYDEIQQSVIALANNVPVQLQYRYAIESMIEAVNLDKALVLLPQSEAALLEREIVAEAATTQVHLTQSNAKRAALEFDKIQRALASAVERVKTVEENSKAAIEQRQMAVSLAHSKLENVVQTLARHSGMGVSQEMRLRAALDNTEAELTEAQKQLEIAQTHAKEALAAAAAQHARLTQSLENGRTRQLNTQAAYESTCQQARQAAEAVKTAKEHVHSAEQAVVAALLPCLYSPLHRHSAFKAYAVAMLSNRLGEKAYSQSMQAALNRVSQVEKMQALISAAQQVSAASMDRRVQAMADFKAHFQRAEAEHLLGGNRPAAQIPLWLHLLATQKMQQVNRILYGAYSREHQSVARSEWVSELYANFSPAQLQQLLPANIRDNQGMNDQYAYNIGDVQQLISAHKTFVTASQEVMEGVTISEPVSTLGGPGTTQSLLGTVSGWAEHARTPHASQLLLVPYLPTAVATQADAGTTVWHWVGLVAATQGSGKVSVAFLDSLTPRTAGAAQAPWHQSVLDTLKANGLTPTVHTVRVQRQNDTRLCGPLLVHSFREIMDKWRQCPGERKIPDSIADVNGQDLRAKDAIVLDHLEGGALGLPFSVRQAWAVRF